jgi:hypothetical protein
MVGESRRGDKHPHGNQVAGKLGGELPFWSPGAAGGRSGKSDSSTHPLFSWAPIVPALVFLIVLILLLSFVESRYWRSPAADIPSPREVFALIRNHGSPLPQDNVKVWTKKQSGFYYCQGDLLFGRKPGKMMKQTDALLSGYRPVRKEYCTSNKPKEESRRSGSAGTTAGAK